MSTNGNGQTESNNSSSEEPDIIAEANDAMEKLVGRFADNLNLDDFTPDNGPRKEGFRVGCLNVRSIKTEGRAKKVTSLIESGKFDIFVLQETNLHKTQKTLPADLNPKGYGEPLRQDRCFKKHKTEIVGMSPKNSENPGGGQLICIKNNVEFAKPSRGEVACVNVQYLHIEITAPVHFHLIAIYSPNKAYWQHVRRIMSFYIVALQGQNIMFIGDLNINLETCNRDEKMFFQTLTNDSYSFQQLITKPTRQHNCIDHIFTNMPTTEAGVRGEKISDHRPIYCTLDNSKIERTPELSSIAQTEHFLGLSTTYTKKSKKRETKTVLRNDLVELSQRLTELAKNASQEQNSKKVTKVWAERFITDSKDLDAIKRNEDILKAWVQYI